MPNHNILRMRASGRVHSTHSHSLQSKLSCQTLRCHIRARQKWPSEHSLPAPLDQNFHPRRKCVMVKTKRRHRPGESSCPPSSGQPTTTKWTTLCIPIQKHTLPPHQTSLHQSPCNHSHQSRPGTLAGTWHPHRINPRIPPARSPI